MTVPFGLHGNRIFPALVTPLTAQGELDAESTERLVDHLYDAGVGGLYVTGSTGEGVHLDEAIRRQTAEVAVERSRNRGHVIVHVGATQVDLARRLASHAADIGADAVASIPCFYGGYAWSEVLDYYRSLVSAGPLPVLSYYIPSLTGQRFTLAEMGQLMQEPGICGLKFTDFNLYLMQRIACRMQPNQVLFNGPDEMLLAGLAMGAHGGIGTTYNFMPQLILKLAGLVASGKLTEAAATQSQINDVIEILLDYPVLPATKQILIWQGLLKTNHCAAPRADMTAAQRDELRRRLSKSAIADTLS